MQPFEAFLQTHEIDPVQLSVFAKVRYMTIWNAMKGNPITAENAEKIKRAVILLTDDAYEGPFVILGSAPIDQLPTLPIRKLKLIK